VGLETRGSRREIRHGHAPKTPPAGHAECGGFPESEIRFFDGSLRMDDLFFRNRP
jgi:hypothetical protein